MTFKVRTATPPPGATSIGVGSVCVPSVVALIAAVSPPPAVVADQAVAHCLI
ncbi:hypothetical protein ACFSB1_05180 [Halopseudomonas phragmitis]|uniref:hypothetical protein n=1 Tax=Pseudomonadaceae TaxID=135621 RepID=UPI0012BAA104|nr:MULTISPECIES: hypothetical protein [Pseudomonadaceae]